MNDDGDDFYSLKDNNENVLKKPNLITFEDNLNKLTK